MITCNLCFQPIPQHQLITPDNNQLFYHRLCLATSLSQTTQKMIPKEDLPEPAICGICKQKDPSLYFIQLPKSASIVHKKCLNTLAITSIQSQLAPHPSPAASHQENSAIKHPYSNSSQASIGSSSWREATLAWTDTTAPHAQHRKYVVYNTITTTPLWESHTMKWTDPHNPLKTCIRKTVSRYENSIQHLLWEHQQVITAGDRHSSNYHKQESVSTYQNEQEVPYWCASTTTRENPQHPSNPKEISTVFVYQKKTPNN